MVDDISSSLDAGGLTMLRDGLRCQITDDFDAFVALRRPDLCETFNYTPGTRVGFLHCRQILPDVGSGGDPAYDTKFATMLRDFGLGELINEGVDLDKVVKSVRRKGAFVMIPGSDGRRTLVQAERLEASLSQQQLQV